MFLPDHQAFPEELQESEDFASSAQSTAELNWKRKNCKMHLLDSSWVTIKSSKFIIYICEKKYRQKSISDIYLRSMDQVHSILIKNLD